MHSGGSGLARKRVCKSAGAHELASIQILRASPFAPSARSRHSPSAIVAMPHSIVQNLMPKPESPNSAVPIQISQPTIGGWS